MTTEKSDAVARIFKCSPEQARSKMIQNLKQLEGMALKAESTGKLVNGYDAEMLRDMIRKLKKGWGL